MRDDLTNPPARSTVIRDLVSTARDEGADYATWFEKNKDLGDFRLVPFTEAAQLWRELTN